MIRTKVSRVALIVALTLTVGGWVHGNSVWADGNNCRPGESCAVPLDETGCHRCCSSAACDGCCTANFTGNKLARCQAHCEYPSVPPIGPPG